MKSSPRMCSMCGAAVSADAECDLCRVCIQKQTIARQYSGVGDELPPTVPSLSPSIGCLLRYFGDYELLEEIARGGMGVVYKARQLRLDRVVAVKMILAGTLTDDSAVRRFYIEAHAAANLQHPNIVAIHEIGEHEGQHFFSMDYIEGRSLAEVIGGRPLPAEQASKYLVTIAEAIQYAHTQGTLHRDLKPSNILIDVNGQPHITDFGLAKKIDGESGLTMSGVIMGSPSYMSPEQACGQHDLVDVRSDVYSLGAVLYELLTGRAPFLAATVMEILRRVQDEEPVSPRLLNKAVPVDLETICVKCLEKSPQKRYASARELAADLRRFLSNEPIVARPVSPLEKSVKWAKRRPAFAALIGVSILAALGFFIGGVWYNAQLRTARDKATVAAEKERVEAERARLAETEAREQQSEAEKARKAAEHNLAFTQLAQAGMFTDAGRFMEAHLLYSSCQMKLQKLGENDFPVKAGLTDLYAASPPALLTFRGHTHGVFGVALSSDGARALSGSYDHDVKLWEVKTGREVRLFKGHQGAVYSVAFSPDGKWALSGSEDKTAKLWEISTGKEVWTFAGHRHGVWAVAFSPDGKWAITTSVRSISVWDVSTGILVRTFSWQEKNSSILGMGVSSDGKYVISAANQDQGISDNSVVMWDLATGQDVRHFKGHLAYSAGFSPDGQFAVSGGIDKLIALWDIKTGNEIRTLVGHRNPVQRVTFSPDGKRILSSGWEPTVRLWDVASGQEIRTFTGHTANVYGADYAPDGRWVLSGSIDKTLKLWEIEPSPEIRSFVGHQASISSVSFSTDGRFALSSSSDGAVRAWDMATGFEIQRFSDGTACAGLSSDGKLALTTCYAKLKLWSMETGKEIRTIPGRFFQGAISPDGKWALSGCYTPVDGLILWDLTTGEKIRDVKNGNGSTTSGITFLPGGKRALSSTDDSLLTLWDLNTGQAIRTFRGHNNRASCVAVSRDGAYALSGGWDQTLRLWEIETGHTIRTFSGHEGHIHSIAFSPDGQWALSGSADNTVKLWNVQSGEEVRTLSCEKEHLDMVAFSPDGKSALIGTSAGVVRHWDFSRPEQYQRYACLMDEAQSRLTKDENDAGALAVLGEYYAFRGVNDWAVEMLERARKGGAQVSSLTLARCFWKLSENKTLEQPGRLRCRSAAANEFGKELARLENQPIPKETEAKLACEQEKLYLSLCLKAVSPQEPGGGGSKPSARTRSASEADNRAPGPLADAKVRQE
jgi:WD40 repeat protein/predicted Ser/Thr protein kinase